MQRLARLYGSFSGYSANAQTNARQNSAGKLQRAAASTRSASGGWGSHGTGPGRFNMPWGIAVSGDGQVFVTDWRNDRVQKFGPDGRFILQWGSPGSGRGEFDRPVGIAVDAAGDVYVVDWHNHRVQIFDRDGEFQAQLTGDATMSTWGEQLLAANPLMM